MRTRERYTFELQCGDKTHIANPIYDKLSKKWQQESNQIFFRQSLDGQLQFVNADYEFIRKCDMAEDIMLTIYRDGKKYIECYFRVVDCDIDENHKSIKVKPKSRDVYNTILDKYNEEYDLLKQNPQLSDVSMDIRPTLQVYELGADYVANYIGGTLYKKSVTPILDLSDYEHFNFGKEYVGTIITTEDTTGSDLRHIVFLGSGNWVATENRNEYVFILQDRDMYLQRPYRMKLRRLIAEGNVYITMEKYTDSNGWTTLYEYKNESTYDKFISYSELNKLKSINLYYTDSGSQVTLNLAIKADFNFSQLNTRILFKGEGGVDIDSQDPFNWSSIYDKSAGVAFTNGLIVGNDVSTDITQFGKVKGEDVYYVPPVADYNYADNLSKYIPVLEEQRTGRISYWLKVDDLLEDLDNIYTTKKTLKDWVSLYETLRVLLKAIDPNIKILHGSTSSMFLFNRTNPLTNLSEQGEMFVLAKSNATTLEYDYSATKTPITIGKVLEWLKTMNIYWDIYELEDGRKIFRLEHLCYYLNGMNYNNNSRKIIDLKTIFDVRNGKHYAYRTNKWKYDISDSMPTTIFYKWAEEVSVPFEGKAMRAVKRLSDEKQETIGTDTFVSDIDYVFANSNEVSKDGFMVVQAYRSNTTEPYAIKYYDCNIDGRDYKLQNGLLSALYIQKSYLPYNLAFRQAEITDGAIVDVKLMKKIRQNDIEFFAPRDIEIDEYTLLTTEVGNGTISDMVQEINSDKIKVTLKYPIDNEY